MMMLLLRFGLSQIDVPMRESYMKAIVDLAERSAAAGISNMACTMARA